MRLYAGSSRQFFEDTVQNQIAEKLKAAFFREYRFNPSPNEVSAWRNSLRAAYQVFQYAELNDHGVILEYRLPLTSQRLDCLVCGRDEERCDQAVIMELKQWDRCEPAESENELLTWVGGGKREVLHPAVQVGQYKQYLEDAHTAFYEDGNPVSLSACTYLHNYNFCSDDPLLDPKFSRTLQRYPVFTADDVRELSGYLQTRLREGEGLDVLQRIEQSRYRPSKKLMEHVGNIIKGKSEYILLDEQLIVYDRVLTEAKKGFHDRKKAVLIVKGGPGTGKSVIAINLMADLLLQEYNAHYATGSRAFTRTLRKVIGPRGAVQFNFFNSFIDASDNDVDVLIADESHRIRLTSNHRFMRREKRSGVPQVQELLKASKVAVFFIDDRQVVRPNEIGSAAYIREAAEQSGARIYEYELQAQFRCQGSDAFVSWVNNTLGIERTAHIIWEGDERFELRIVSSPEELERLIRSKVSEGSTGRVVAGYCWEWTYPREDGTLNDDVVIGDYRRPWNARPEAKRLAKGIPPAELWAYDPNGINQVGCVYTAQGFEFDYVGVIFGPDLRYNLDRQVWEGHSESSADGVVKRAKENFVDLVKNTYRVLLSRGLRGCYIYFMDQDTERFFRSRMESPAGKSETFSTEPPS